MKGHFFMVKSVHDLHPYNKLFKKIVQHPLSAGYLKHGAVYAQ